MEDYNFAVVGASGMVGRKMLQVLEERELPIKSLRLFATERSAGEKIIFNNNEYIIEDLQKADIQGIDIALFSVGGATSREWAPRFVKTGSLVVDNSSAWRMDSSVPLIVPEVNKHAITPGKREIIANPNCSTIQLVMAIKPIYDHFGITRMVISTYQAVSGSGWKGISQLKNERNGDSVNNPFYPYQIDLNCLVGIGKFDSESGYFEEEIKMMRESRKILDDDSIAATCTAVRVPVYTSHCESVNIECKKNFTIENIRDILQKFPGIVVIDDPEKGLYPLPIDAAEKDEVFVGRIRRDTSYKNCFNMWVVGDNLRKGAATNAVQIVQEWIRLDNY